MLGWVQAGERAVAWFLAYLGFGGFCSGLRGCKDGFHIEDPSQKRVRGATSDGGNLGIP